MHEVGRIYNMHVRNAKYIHTKFDCAKSGEAVT